MTAPIDWQARYEALAEKARALLDALDGEHQRTTACEAVEESLRAALAPTTGAEGREPPPLTVRCPRCGAPPGFACSESGESGLESHAERVVPTPAAREHRWAGAVEDCAYVTRCMDCKSVDPERGPRNVTPCPGPAAPAAPLADPSCAPLTVPDPLPAPPADEPTIEEVHTWIDAYDWTPHVQRTAERIAVALLRRMIAESAPPTPAPLTLTRDLVDSTMRRLVVTRGEERIGTATVPSEYVMRPTPAPDVEPAAPACDPAPEMTRMRDNLAAHELARAAPPTPLAPSTTRRVDQEAAVLDADGARELVERLTTALRSIPGGSQYVRLAADADAWLAGRKP